MKRYVKITAAVLLLLAFAITAAGCSLGGSNVGVVDINKVMTDSPKVKTLQDQLNAKGKELSDQLDKDRPNLSAADFQKKQQDAYNQFLQTKQDYENQIDASVKQAVQQIAQQKHMNVVLYKNSTAYGGTDITDDVIKSMQ